MDLHFPTFLTLNDKDDLHEEAISSCLTVPLPPLPPLPSSYCSLPKRAGVRPPYNDHYSWKQNIISYANLMSNTISFS